MPDDVKADYGTRAYRSITASFQSRQQKKPHMVSGKLPSLSGTSLPHGGRRPVKAQDDKLTVPSLAVNSGVYRIRGVIGAVGCSSVACPKGRLGTSFER